MTVLQTSSFLEKTTKQNLGRTYKSILVMLGITLSMLGVIGSRLVQLQLVQGERNRQLAESNRIRLLPKQPVRGDIFDRKGKILATSRLSRSVFLWPLDLDKTRWPQTRIRLAQILKTPEKELQNRLDKSLDFKSNEPGENCPERHIGTSNRHRRIQPRTHRRSSRNRSRTPLPQWLLRGPRFGLYRRN